MSDSINLTPQLDPSWPQRFAVRRYRPDGGASIVGMLLLVGLLGLAGAVMGFIASWISQWFYLIFLFPVAISFVVAIVGCVVIQSTKIRSPLLCGLAGCMAGCLSVAVMHYSDYQRFNRQLDTQFGEALPVLQEIAMDTQRARTRLSELDETEKSHWQKVIDELEKDDEFRSAMRIKSFWEFLDREAHHGVKLWFRPTIGTSLGHVGTWIYWGIEALVISGVVGFMMKFAAAEPFCVNCNSWKKASVCDTSADPMELCRKVEAGEIAPGEPSTTTASEFARITAFRCEGCNINSTVDIRIEKVTLSSERRETTKTLGQFTYPPEAYEALTKAFSPFKAK